ncbi:MAG: hypothetical protein ACRCS8_04825 [Brevinema sp.]
MNRLTRIRNIIRWQELYQNKRSILAIYEDDETRLEKLKNDSQSGIANQERLETQHNALAEKIASEESRLDEILNKIEMMEKDRDNLKMARQIKSWEKDMEKYSQDREILEAQLYYDKSKISDTAQELETVGQSLSSSSETIVELEKSLTAVKAETASQMNKIETEMLTISKEFDAHFAEYFERLLLKNKGVVMAVVEDDSCSGCNILLPTSYHGGDTLQDSEDSALPQCPNCFRYLYYSEDV